MNNPIDIGTMYGINNRNSYAENNNHNMHMSTEEIIDEMNMPVQNWREDDRSCNASITPYNLQDTMHYSDNNIQQNMYANQNQNYNMNNRNMVNQGKNISSNNSKQRHMHSNTNNTQIIPMPHNTAMPDVSYSHNITIKNPYMQNQAGIEYMNELLRTQVGKMAEVEFLIGTNSTHLKQGQITAVGTNYIVIKEFDTGRTTVGNFDNIKFVTIYDTEYNW